jgi:hypothetical protein
MGCTRGRGISPPRSYGEGLGVGLSGYSGGGERGVAPGADFSFASSDFKTLGAFFCNFATFHSGGPSPGVAHGQPRARVPHLVGSRLPSPYHFQARIQSFQAFAAPFPGDSILPSRSRGPRTYAPNPRPFSLYVTSSTPASNRSPRMKRACRFSTLRPPFAGRTASRVASQLLLPMTIPLDRSPPAGTVAE